MTITPIGACVVSVHFRCLLLERLRCLLLERLRSLLTDLCFLLFSLSSSLAFLLFSLSSSSSFSVNNLTLCYNEPHQQLISTIVGICRHVLNHPTIPVITLMRMDKLLDLKAADFLRLNKRKHLFVSKLKMTVESEIKVTPW